VSAPLALFGERPKGKATRYAEAFLAKNPWVYDAFRHHALALIETRERKRYSGMTIVNMIRWHDPRKTATDGLPMKFRIGNHTASFLSRMFLMEFPQHRSFFDLKPAEADYWPGPPGWEFSGTPVRAKDDDRPEPSWYYRGPAE